MPRTRELTPYAMSLDLLGLSIKDCAAREGYGWSATDSGEDIDPNESENIDLAVYHLPSSARSVDNLLDPYSNVIHKPPFKKVQTINDVGNTIETSHDFEYPSDPFSLATHSQNTDLYHQSNTIRAIQRFDFSINTSGQDLDSYSNTNHELPTHTDQAINGPRNTTITTLDASFHHFNSYSQTSHETSPNLNNRPTSKPTKSTSTSTKTNISNATLRHHLHPYTKHQQ